MNHFIHVHRFVCLEFTLFIESVDKDMKLIWK